MGFALFAICAFAWVFVALRVARRFGDTTGERFWIAVAALAVQNGIIAGALSAFHLLTPIGWTILQLLLAIAVLPLSPKSIVQPRDVLKLTGRIALSAVLLCIAIVLLEQSVIPIHGDDELAYHAPRVIHWIQNATVFPYAFTHDLRQTVFPFGGELFFLWPMLLTRCELLGRLSVFLTYPLIVFGVYHTLRELEQTRTVSLLGALIIATTPAVYIIAIGIKPDLWCALFTLGFAFWAIHAVRTRATLAMFMAALFVILAINVKSTALILLIPLAWLIIRQRRPFPALVAITLGIMLSGLWITWSSNFADSGSILGSKVVRAVHQPTYSIHQMWTHLLRVPLELAEVPILPRRMAQRATLLGRKVATTIGADRPLQYETDATFPRWPGQFFYGMYSPARKFSLQGIFWLPALLLAIFLSRRRPPIAMLTLICIVTLVGEAFFIRWMFMGPPRFWLPAFAPAMVLETIFLARAFNITKHEALTPWIRIVIVTLFAWVLVGTLVYHRQLLTKAINGYTDSELNDPFDFVLPHLSRDDHLLLIAYQQTPEYVLFGWRQNANRTVTSWDMRPFDSIKLNEVIATNHITHVLIEDKPLLVSYFSPPILSQPFLNYLRGDTRFSEIPVPGPVRIFAVKPPV